MTHEIASVPPKERPFPWRPCEQCGAVFEAKRRIVRYCGKSCQDRAYRQADPEKKAARDRAYREANREKVAARHRAYRAANPEKIREWGRAQMRKKNAQIRARSALADLADMQTYLANLEPQKGDSHAVAEPQ